MNVRAPIRTAPKAEERCWKLHRKYLAHMYQEPPCPDCVRDKCPTARLLDEAADEAGRAWGRQTGGWW